MNLLSMWNDEELTSYFLNKTPLIDVRAPIEFKDGSVPYSINIPILDDEEREKIGTCYKEQGQEEAIKLGHQLISGGLKEKKINQWEDYLKEFPNAEIFCFRGGLRSQMTCQWLGEKGYTKHPIKGGYKRLRNFFLSWLSEGPIPKMIRIGGPTGSGKTQLLHHFSNHIDLENLANHKGSAFGFCGQQPSQVSFENHLAQKILELQKTTIILEDESATIGQRIIPNRFFSLMRSSPLVILEVSMDERIQNIFSGYVQNNHAEFFNNNLQRIQKKLGKSKVNKLISDIESAFSKPMNIIHHEGWISTLLSEYYDPLYQKDLRHNKDKIFFEGNAEEVKEFLTHNSRTNNPNT
jgi:tRNA 2-selenouridine synthase